MQYAFCSAYIRNGFVIKDAAIEAGYSPLVASTQAYKLLQNPAIKQAVSKAIVKAENRLGLTFEWKLKKLKTVIDSIIPDNDFKPSKHTKIALQAISELNKMHGDYAPDKHLRLTVDATQDKLEQARLEYKDV